MRQDKERASRLHLAIEARDLAEVTACLDDGISANTPNWLGTSPLARGAQAGSVEIVALLLDRGASVNRRENDGGLALHGSLRHHPDSRILDLLLARGLSPHVRVHGKTSVMEAARLGALDFVRRLIDLGVDPHAVSDEGRSALDEAVSRQRTDVAEYLRGLGVTEHHASRRALVRALLRAFGGKATEITGGDWRVNPKRLGRNVSFQVRSGGHSMAFHSLRFHARALAGKQWGVLRVWHRDSGAPIQIGKHLPGHDALAPEPAPCDLAGAFRDAPLRAASRGDATDDARKALVAACRDAEETFAALHLGDGDELAIGAGAIVLLAAGHEPDLATRRAAALLRLVEHLALDRSPPKPLIADVLNIQVARGASAVTPGPGAAHRWGGMPDARIACPHCTAWLAPVLKLDLRDPRLAIILPGVDSFEALLCPDCADWGPLFLDHSQRPPAPIAEENAEDDASDDASDDPPEQLLPARDVRLEAATTRASARSRVGGAPSWLQGEDTPECPRCHDDMAFVLQLVSRADISFGDEGRLYVFTCARCRVSATLVQSH